MRPRRIILHCSATADSGDRFGASDIDEWHRAKGWQQIGYHIVVRRSGAIERGREDHVQGAHTKGHNQNSLGICYMGTKSPTLAQILSLMQLYKGYLKKYQIPWHQWYGHRELVATECPGFDMEAFRLMLCIFHDQPYNFNYEDLAIAWLDTVTMGRQKR